MRDYLNYISAPNDDRPLIMDFDPLTGIPGAAVTVAVEAAAEPAKGKKAKAATPVADAPVEAAPAAPEAVAEASPVETPVGEAQSN